MQEGQKLGRLTLVSPRRTERPRRVMWLCRCACGTEREIRADRLASGEARSCGCARTAKHKALMAVVFEAAA